MATTKAKKMSQLKRADREESCDTKTKKKKVNPPTDETCPPKATEFKGYDLNGLPSDALPLFGHEYKRQHSYTLNISGAVTRFFDI